MRLEMGSGISTDFRFHNRGEMMPCVALSPAIANGRKKKEEIMIRKSR